MHILFTATYVHARPCRCRHTRLMGGVPEEDAGSVWFKLPHPWADSSDRMDKQLDRPFTGQGRVTHSLPPWPGHGHLHPASHCPHPHRSSVRPAPVCPTGAPHFSPEHRPGLVCRRAPQQCAELMAGPCHQRTREPMSAPRVPVLTPPQPTSVPAYAVAYSVGTVPREPSWWLSQSLVRPP